MKRFAITVTLLAMFAPLFASAQMYSYQPYMMPQYQPVYMQQYWPTIYQFGQQQQYQYQYPYTYQPQPAPQNYCPFREILCMQGWHAVSSGYDSNGCPTRQCVPDAYNYYGQNYYQPQYYNTANQGYVYPYSYSYATGNTDAFGNSLCYWSDYQDAAPCGSDPEQWIYDPYTGTWY